MDEDDSNSSDNDEEYGSENDEKPEVENLDEDGEHGGMRNTDLNKRNNTVKVQVEIVNNLEDEVND